MKKAHQLVESLFKDLQLDKLPARRRIIREWDNVVGETLSRMCSPEGFQGSTLIVRAENPGAAMELRYRSSELITALNEIAGEEVFSRLKILLRPTGPAGEKER